VAGVAEPGTPVPVAVVVIASSLAAGVVVPRPTLPAAVWYRCEFPIFVVLVQSGM